jgi:hypothetical protein
MLVGKFGNYATALCPISKMTTPMVDLNESEDIIPLNLLPDFVVNAYRPLDTVMLAISQPASLCVLHEDIVSCLELVTYYTKVACFSFFTPNQTRHNTFFFGVNSQSK